MYSHEREQQSLDIKNCFSIVYYKLDLVPADLYVEPPSYRKLLEKFKRVSDINEAVAVAAAILSNWSRLKVSHIGLLTADKKSILHRDGPGVDTPVVEEKIEVAMRTYLEKPKVKLVYLALKLKK